MSSTPPSSVSEKREQPLLRGQPVWPGLSNEDSWERRERQRHRWQWLALLISVALHVYLFLAFQNDFLGLHKLRERAEQPPEEVFEMTLETEIPEEEKPYVQTNPEAFENEPDQAPFVSNRDQQAAQEDPDPNSDDPLPTVMGEEASQNVVESTLEEPEPPAPMVQAIPETGQPAPEMTPADPAQPVVAQGGGSPQVEEVAEDPSIPEAFEPTETPIDSPAQPQVDPSQALDAVTAISPPPDFLQGEPDPDAAGDGLGLTPVDPGQDTTPFIAQVRTRVIPTVRPSMPNFRVVTKTPQVAQPVFSEQPRPSDQQGDTEEEAQEAENQQEQQETPVQSGTPGQDPQMPRPRPQIITRSTPAPLMDARDSRARREGVVSPDAEWTAFGDYQSRMIEQIANAWYRTLRTIQRRVGDSGTRVTVQFELLNDGSVRAMKTTFYSSSELMMNICRDAIKSRDPYEVWPQDMVDMFGESKTITINFHYY